MRSLRMGRRRGESQKAYRMRVLEEAYRRTLQGRRKSVKRELLEDWAGR